MRYEFIKMEATGNDYVYMDALDRDIIPSFSTEQIARISHRRFGIGGDGLVILGPSSVAEAKMHMWNSDGSPSDMCGNALRCVAFLVYKRIGKREFLIESGAGIHQAKILDSSGPDLLQVEVEMGAPRFEAASVPFRGDALGIDLSHHTDGAPLADLKGEGSQKVPGDLTFTALSMGNPHCVVFVPDAMRAPVESLGPLLENHPAFPERTNVEFVSVDEKGELVQRTHERGSGETLSCGSGACAALVASAVTGRGPGKNRIHLLGGDLEVEWDRSDSDAGKIFLRGPAHLVCTGSFELQGLMERG